MGCRWRLLRRRLRYQSGLACHRGASEFRFTNLNLRTLLRLIGSPKTACPAFAMEFSQERSRVPNPARSQVQVRLRRRRRPISGHGSNRNSPTARSLNLTRSEGQVNARRQHHPECQSVCPDWRFCAETTTSVTRTASQIRPMKSILPRWGLTI